MKDYYQTTEQLSEPLRKNWSLYAPVLPNDILDLELAYWAKVPKNRDDAFVCPVSAFSLADVNDELTYHALLPETWAEAQIKDAELGGTARDNTSKLLSIPIGFCFVFFLIFSVPLKLLFGSKVKVCFVPELDD